MVAKFLFIPLTSLKLTLFFYETFFTHPHVRISYMCLCASDPESHA